MAVQDDDFDPKQAIAALLANLEQPDKFAHLFCEAAKKQKAIDDVLKENIRALIKHDIEVINSIKYLQRQVDKEDWKFFLKKMGTSSWAILLLMLGAMLQALSGKYLG